MEEKAQSTIAFSMASAWSIELESYDVTLSWISSITALRMAAKCWNFESMRLDN